MGDRLKVEYVDIDSINPYPNNAKLHPAEQIEQIKKSIEEFGMNDPIGVWHDEVVEGHGRLIACKELNYGVVPIIRLDDLNEEQRRAYMLVHNQLTMNSGFDFELLDVELDNIDVDMEQFGFDLSVDNINSNDLEEEQRSLSDDFIIPPFDIFDARSRRWLDRKSMWNNKIGDMGQARADAQAYEQKAFNNKESYRRNGKMTTLDTVKHYFEPQGFTKLYLLCESHFAIHTFPEEGKSYIELSSCNEKMHEKFMEIVKGVERAYTG